MSLDSLLGKDIAEVKLEHLARRVQSQITAKQEMVPPGYSQRNFPGFLTIYHAKANAIHSNDYVTIIAKYKNGAYHVFKSSLKAGSLLNKDFLDCQYHPGTSYSIKFFDEILKLPFISNIQLINLHEPKSNIKWNTRVKNATKLSDYADLLIDFLGFEKEEVYLAHLCKKQDCSGEFHYMPWEKGINIDLHQQFSTRFSHRVGVTSIIQTYYLIDNDTIRILTSLKSLNSPYTQYDVLQRLDEVDFKFHKCAGRTKGLANPKAHFAGRIPSSLQNKSFFERNDFDKALSKFVGNLSDYSTIRAFSTIRKKGRIPIDRKSPFPQSAIILETKLFVTARTTINTIVHEAGHAFMHDRIMGIVQKWRNTRTRDFGSWIFKQYDYKKVRIEDLFCSLVHYNSAFTKTPHHNSFSEVYANVEEFTSTYHNDKNVDGTSFNALEYIDATWQNTLPDPGRKPGRKTLNQYLRLFNNWAISRIHNYYRNLDLTHKKEMKNFVKTMAQKPNDGFFTELIKFL